MYFTQYLIILTYYFGSQLEQLVYQTIYASVMYNTMNNKLEIKIISEVGHAILGLNIHNISYSTLKQFSVGRVKSEKKTGQDRKLLFSKNLNT